MTTVLRILLALAVVGLAGCSSDDAAGLVLVVDPDAPSGSFILWVVWNIEPDATVEEVRDAIADTTVATTTLVGTWERT